MLFLVAISHMRFSFFFFFNDTATTEIYTLSLHDALPIYCCQLDKLTRLIHESGRLLKMKGRGPVGHRLSIVQLDGVRGQDRKSTRLNSSHDQISYAVFCLKKKTNNTKLKVPTSSI